MSNQIDVTEKFEKALIGFACDFNLAEMGINHLAELDKILKREDTDKHKQRLVKDIELLNELETLLRYGKIKIVEVTEWTEII